MFDETIPDLSDSRGNDEGLPVTDGGQVAETNGVAAESDGHARHAEAGRKGAARVHQLIRQGRQYEQEHGLKRGRQRLRQLIEEGKLYEQEHGLRPTRKPRKRLGQTGREQLLRTFLETVVHMVKPSYRHRLKEILAALEVAGTIKGSGVD